MASHRHIDNQRYIEILYWKSGGNINFLDSLYYRIKHLSVLISAHKNGIRNRLVIKLSFAATSVASIDPKKPFKPRTEKTDF